MAILNVPQGQQSFSYDCGIKALQLLMAYYGEEVPYETLFKSVKHHKVYGITNEGMVRLARRHGFKPQQSNNGSLEDIKKHIREGDPVIVAFQAWADGKMKQADWKVAGIGDNEDYGHYAIVVGFQDGKVIFNDPVCFRRVWLTEQEFKNRWHADNEYGYALVLKGMKPLKKDMEHIDKDDIKPTRIILDGHIKHKRRMNRIVNKRKPSNKILSGLR